jgi:hypothetical protein
VPGPVEIPETVVYEILDGEAIVLDSSSGTCFRLNPTATRAWELLVQHGDLGEVRRAMLADFEVEVDTLDGDLDKLVVELEAKALIVVRRMTGTEPDR